MNPRFSLQRALSVARKESLHIFRDPATLFFALFIPVLEMFMLGYAIDTNVRRVSTIVLDQAKTRESRELLQMLEMFFDRAIYYAAVGYEEEVAQAPREADMLRVV